MRKHPKRHSQKQHFTNTPSEELEDVLKEEMRLRKQIRSNDLIFVLTIIMLAVVVFSSSAIFVKLAALSDYDQDFAGKAADYLNITAGNTTLENVSSTLMVSVNEDGSEVVHENFVSQSGSFDVRFAGIFIEGMRTPLDAVTFKKGFLNDDSDATTEVIAFSDAVLEFEQATIILKIKDGAHVDVVRKCLDFDIDGDNFRCTGGWFDTDIPFKTNGTAINFTVTSFSSYAGGTGSLDRHLKLYHDNVSAGNINQTFNQSANQSSNTIQDSNTDDTVSSERQKPAWFVSPIFLSSAIFAVLVVIFGFIFVYRSVKKRRLLEGYMIKLDDYIETGLRKGHKPENLVKALTEQGWTKEMIGNRLAKLEKRLAQEENNEKI